uniref:Rep family protein n=1 Tax=Enterocloster hominis (ex Hitch et al. 2024) TaxID=1917870 RepID=UPI001030F767|nr:Rep family protein [Lachnoclostridium pacaense]
MGETLKLRMCEICQQTAHIDSIDKMIQTIKSNQAVEKYAYIIHDKDVDDSGTLKAEHIHIMIKFAYSYNVMALAKQLNLKSQYIQQIQSRRYEDALLYLTHANAQDKYQYSLDAVKANFDYQAICERYLKRKEQATSKLSEKEHIRSLCDEIVQGKIRRYNYFELIDTDFCIRYRTRFENAFKVRDDILKAQENRTLEVIYMVGDSGSGKTTYAKKIATQKGYSYFVSSASNDVLDGYAGQDCVILDDLRPSCLGLSDLLKLLDNHTQSTAKSRYYNKILECKLIIITTVINIEEFFKNVFQEQNEPLTQLKRRCSTYLEFTKQEIRVSMYDATLQDYKYINNIKNPIADLYPSQSLTEDIATAKLKNLLGDYQITSTDDFMVVEPTDLPFD